MLICLSKRLLRYVALRRWCAAGSLPTAAAASAAFSAGARGSRWPGTTSRDSRLPVPGRVGLLLRARCSLALSGTATAVPATTGAAAAAFARAAREHDRVTVAKAGGPRRHNAITRGHSVEHFRALVPLD